MALDVGVQIKDNVVLLDSSVLQNERWQAFAQGEHIAMLKGDRLIVHQR